MQYHNMPPLTKYDRNRKYDWIVIFFPKKNNSRPADRNGCLF